MARKKIDKKIGKSPNELIHVRFDYDEALEAKKNLLSSERDLLRLMQIIQYYRRLRVLELKKKEKFKAKISILITNIRKLQTIMPRAELPEILRKEEYKEIKKLDRTIETQKRQYDDTLELELREIQDKLKELERR